MRYLALDYGEKRIGLAVSDPLNLTAQPLSYLYNDKSFFVNFQKVLAQYETKNIILGLPKSMNGKENFKTEEVKLFAQKLEIQLGCQIMFQDERLSTVAVTKHLIAADVSRAKRKNIVDSQAAAFILQGFLDRGVTT